MDKKNIKLKFDLEKNQERTYIRIPLEIPENVERIDITYSYEGSNKDAKPIGEKNVIDIAVLDPDGNDAGATGSEYQSITLGESYASHGFKRQKLTAGTWFIVLGAYMIKPEGVTVEYDITFWFKHYRWLKGDPHIHSTNSDGKKDYLGLAKLATKKGLDFLILTDHNNTVIGGVPIVDGLTLIDGVEFTNYFGHFNFWGVARPYGGSYSVFKKEDFLKLHDEAAGKGALRFINHPISACPWMWGYDFDFNGIEVWNGLMSKENLASVQVWDDLLKTGRKLVAVGGSDFHTFSPLFFARPTTVIYTLSPSAEDILDAIKRGRVAILNSPKAAMLYIESDGELAGGTVTLGKDTTVTVRCDKLKKGHSLVLYNQNGEIFRYKAKKSGAYNVTLPVTEKGYIRAEIRYKGDPIIKIKDFIIGKLIGKNPLPPAQSFIYSMTNPIYFD